MLSVLVQERQPYQGSQLAYQDFLQQCVAMMTNAEDTAREFVRGRQGRELLDSGRYYRFNVPQGMEDLKLDDFKKLEKMNALTTHYLGNPTPGNAVTKCVDCLMHQREATNLQSSKDAAARAKGT